MHSEESAVEREKVAVERLAAAASVLRHHLDPARPIEVRLGDGTGVDTLLDLSGRTSVIVLQRRTIGALQRWHTGSTTSRVAAEAQCPVIVLRDDHEDSLGRHGVVVGVDNRGHASVAVETAFAEASRRRTSLIAAHAWQFSGPTAAFSYVPADPDEIAAKQTQAELELATALAGFGSAYPDVIVRRELIIGVPQQVLDAVAADAELLVVGRHSSNRVPTLALGGVARHCLANSRCTVMIVPAGHSRRRGSVLPLSSEVSLSSGH